MMTIAIQLAQCRNILLLVRNLIREPQRMDTNWKQQTNFFLQTDAPDNLVGDLTFHQFNMILSGVSTGLTCLVIFASMFNHAIHLSDPNRQIK